ncbi:ProQ/FINO family protein [Aquabacterium parvum]|uniref:ProQ/FINO family protein n=1 Tax=Aquabacterium parvum TaxID=70584 RepID=UPI0009FB218D|nr:ProQ/FinO family protein [Aquabacterium parvum]MBU0915387.1 ProQ/FinO family protein [Gammaproteobacteria bacterium]
MSATPENQPDEQLPAAGDTPPADGETGASGAAVASQADQGAQPDQPTVADTKARLAELFPALFRGEPKPLKLRIQADIQERAPGEFTKQVLSAFLRRHTGTTSYLIAASKAKQRFDLDGQPAGEFSEEHRQVALEELARRRGNQQAKREQEEAGRRERAALLRGFETTKLTVANFCALKGIAPEQLDAVLAQARAEAAEDAARPRPTGRPDHRGGPRGEGRGDGRGDGRGERRADGGRRDDRGGRGQGKGPRGQGAPGGPRRDGAQGKPGERRGGPRREGAAQASAAASAPAPEPKPQDGGADQA